MFKVVAAVSGPVHSTSQVLLEYPKGGTSFHMPHLTIAGHQILRGVAMAAGRLQGRPIETHRDRRGLHSWLTDFHACDTMFSKTGFLASFSLLLICKILQCQDCEFYFFSFLFPLYLIKSLLRACIL